MKGAKHTIILKPNKGTNYYRGGGPEPNKKQMRSITAIYIAKKNKTKNKTKARRPSAKEGTCKKRRKDDTTSLRGSEDVRAAKNVPDWRLRRQN